jgi:hypothetical protein
MFPASVNPILPIPTPFGSHRFGDPPRRSVMRVIAIPMTFVSPLVRPTGGRIAGEPRTDPQHT